MTPIAARVDELVGRAADLAATFAGTAAEHDRDGSFPFENFAALRGADLLNVTVPREFGGHGLGLCAACRILEPIGRGDASTALVLAMHYIAHASLVLEDRWPRSLYEQVRRARSQALRW